MKTYKSESDVLPLEWDKTSSEVCVYHNTNIVEIPATDERPKHYEYDVEEYSNKEFISLLDDNLNALVEGRVE